MVHCRGRWIMLCLAVYVAVLSIVISGMGRTLKVGAVLRADPIIIIDPGHGGFDGGAEGANGTIEKDINLPIALKLRDFLGVYGIRTIMTRDSDQSTCDSNLEGISNKKISDIQNRMNLIQEHPDSIFLSIHQNQYPDASSFGAQMFYGPQSEQSAILAERLQQNFIQMLCPDNHRKIKPADESVYLMYHCPVPGVLIECGFLSNPAEEELLQSDEYQNQIAFVIADSLMEYLEESIYPQIPPTKSLSFCDAKVV